MESTRAAVFMAGNIATTTAAALFFALTACSSSDLGTPNASKDNDANAGADGVQGVQGEQGLAGPEGPQGQQGVQGAAGLGITFKGQVATEADLPAGAAQGDAYIVQADDSFWVWDGASGSWVNGGSIQGPQGIDGPQGPQGLQDV